MTRRIVNETYSDMRSRLVKKLSDVYLPLQVGSQDIGSIRRAFSKFYLDIPSIMGSAIVEDGIQTDILILEDGEAITLDCGLNDVRVFHDLIGERKGPELKRRIQETCLSMAMSSAASLSQEISDHGIFPGLREDEITELLERFLQMHNQRLVSVSRYKSLTQKHYEIRVREGKAAEYSVRKEKVKSPASISKKELRLMKVLDSFLRNETDYHRWRTRVLGQDSRFYVISYSKKVKRDKSHLLVPSMQTDRRSR